MDIIKKLAEEKIQTRPIWGLIHEQIPYHGTYSYHIEKAVQYWEHVVNIPCSTNLKEEDLERVAETILRA